MDVGALGVNEKPRPAYNHHPQTSYSMHLVRSKERTPKGQALENSLEFYITARFFLLELHAGSQRAG